jgi:hypothetical protein
LCLIIKKRTTQKSEKILILSSHFYISMQELLDKVKEAKKETKERAAKKGKIKGKDIIQDAKNKEDKEEEAINKLESDLENCIIVDVD